MEPLDPPRSSASSARLKPLLSAGLVLAFGLSTKLYGGPAQSWVNSHLGGVFYVVFWCLLLHAGFPRRKPLRIAIVVFLATSFLEITQLSDGQALSCIRRSFAGRSLVGSHLDWWDFPHYLLGGLAGVAWIRLLPARTPVD